MAVIATGGYGRGLQAPGSDIDLLFVLPYKQTAWGESIAEAILYCLWDMGLKVGHATRSVDECIRQCQGRHHHPHRHPGSTLSCSATARCSTNCRRASMTRWCATRPPNSSPPSSPSARSAIAAPASRAIWSSPM